ncbi:hypothetical protein CXF85_09220 [Colwellia sp. 75C3]|uniref:TIGR02270 family protein n=1 Tax=Colwellia sp. 75C3 TaxID=888425 RepID=UPI000C337505|nr:TIGR02270 family protein [Colwellia sp. 75C3]PKG84090.1 hypothetical protein CXF85_09220 [Colwellia sp. 75C3]
MLNKKNLLEQQSNAFRDITEQFYTDAAFLWEMRAIAVNQPHYDQESLLELEVRLNANLDGLMSTFELSWNIALEQLEYEQGGECFAAAIIAFRSRDLAKIKTIVDHAFTNDDTFIGLASALVWLPKALVNDWINKFLYSKSLDHKYLAIAVCSMRRKNPGDVIQDILTRDDCLTHHKLLARTLRLVGELKLYVYANIAETMLQHEDPSVAFWANWALLLLGEKKHINNLYPFINEVTPHQIPAIQIAFKVLPAPQARAWISELAKNPDHIRAVIIASGVLGDPHTIPWLIDRMKSFETAKIAGEAFVLITGIDLNRYELIIDTPGDITVVPNDDNEDEMVELDDDEHLPFPYVSKISHMWLKHRTKFIPGSRYILGVELGQNNPAASNKLNQVIQHSSQRQRHSAALSLALLDPQSPLFNTKARKAV